MTSSFFFPQQRTRRFGADGGFIKTRLPTRLAFQEASPALRRCKRFPTPRINTRFTARACNGNYRAMARPCKSYLAPPSFPDAFFKRPRLWQLIEESSKSSDNSLDWRKLPRTVAMRVIINAVRADHAALSQCRNVSEFWISCY